MKRWFQDLSASLAKTREAFFTQIRSIFQGKTISPQWYEELEELLIEADVGTSLSHFLIEELKKSAQQKQIHDPNLLFEDFKNALIKIFNFSFTLNLKDGRVNIILICGVNGTGKTTTAAKLGYWFKKSGKRVMFAAADTFRAAAIDQLLVWAKRLEIPCIQQKEGSDPAAVAYDAYQSALAKHFDILLIDTAGRLHTKVNLMEELKKIKRVLQKEDSEAPHETLLVLDATIGQNALQQARLFKENLQISGLVLTKLDGTAKGGSILGIAHELRIPIYFIGVGEHVEDLKPFHPQEFIEGLLTSYP